jgi:predicted DNA-binding protein (MmcQ/YjbR family)
MANIEWVRKFCLALPGTTEQIQWGDDLIFKVAGKMFAGMPLEPAGHAHPEWPWLSFKTAPEEFAELTERPGVRPAAYMARAQWISLESEEALPRAEVERLLRQSYELVVAKLPKKTQAQIASGEWEAKSEKRKGKNRKRK